MTETARAPGYWKYETSGTLKWAVEAYLRGTPMTVQHIAAMRAYLRQWIGAPVWDQHADPAAHTWLNRMRADVDRLTTREEITKWIDAATDNGLDPL